jgi:hypothetical protein
VSIEDTTQCWKTGRTAVLVQFCAEGLRVEQPQLIRRVYGRLQLVRVQKGGEVEQGATQARNRDSLAIGSIRLPEITSPVNPNPGSPVALGCGNRDVDGQRPIPLHFMAEFCFEKTPQVSGAPMTQHGLTAARQDSGRPPATRRQPRPSHREDSAPQSMKAPGSNAPVDLVGAEPPVEELAPRQHTMLEVHQAPEPHGISRTLRAHIRERTHDPNFAPARARSRARDIGSRTSGRRRAWSSRSADGSPLTKGESWAAGASRSRRGPGR